MNEEQNTPVAPETPADQPAEAPAEAPAETTGTPEEGTEEKPE